MHLLQNESDSMTYEQQQSVPATNPNQDDASNLSKYFLAQYALHEAFA